MNSFSTDFVYEKFSEFYKTSSAKILLPTSAPQREFAFLLLKERAMLRHRGFANATSFRRFISETVPSDVYRSCAYYENPEAEMDKKGWLGADLVFDIDADHIPTDCDKLHDEWTCSKCGFISRGVAPEACPACGGLKFDAKSWPCERCVGSARDETVKLLEMLENDFGFSDQELHVFFSGHRGYHVHVETEAIRTLDSIARKEIVDYITGLGLNLSIKQQKSPVGKVKSRIFGLHEFGRYGRLKQDMYNFVEKATKKDLVKAGIKGVSLTSILKYKKQVLDRCIGKGLWNSVIGVKDETWFKIAAYLTNLQVSAIDTVVTTDIHRLIRMNDTLHGKTGFKKIGFPANRLADFDPFKEAVAFKGGAVKVSVSDVPKFRLGGNVFGPYRLQVVELPTAAAVLLICKGRAEVVT